MNDPDILAIEIFKKSQSKDPSFKEYLITALNDFYQDVYEEAFTAGCDTE